MTMHTQASKLDTTKFAKVHVLMSKGATARERDAARAAATKMAQRAGLTLDQAMSKMDSKPKAADPSAAFWESIVKSRRAQAGRSASRRDSLLNRFALSNQPFYDNGWLNLS